MNNKLLSIIILASLSVGCSTMRVPAKVTHPAEVDMTSYKKIAIMDIDGNYGDHFRDTIKTKLSSSGQFDVQNCASKIRMVETSEEVIDNSHKKLSDVDKITAVAGLFMTGKLNVPTHTKKRTVVKRVALRELPKECKRENLNVAAIIKGNYNGTFKTDLHSSKSTCKNKDKKEYSCLTYTRKASVTIEGSIDVINTKTGGIIATKHINDVCNASSWSKETKPRIIEEQSLKHTCISRNSTSFIRKLTPWTETVMVAYQKDGDLPRLEQGVKLVELGRYKVSAE